MTYIYICVCVCACDFLNYGLWDLAHIMVYFDSVLTFECTVNLEIDMPEANKIHTHTHIYIYIYIYIYGGQEMDHKNSVKNALKQVNSYSSIFSVNNKRQE
jgi:hypothetical protein